MDVNAALLRLDHAITRLALFHRRYTTDHAAQVTADRDALAIVRGTLAARDEEIARTQRELHRREHMVGDMQTGVATFRFPAEQ